MTTESEEKTPQTIGEFLGIPEDRPPHAHELLKYTLETYYPDCIIHKKAPTEQELQIAKTTRFLNRKNYEQACEVDKVSQHVQRTWRQMRHIWAMCPEDNEDLSDIREMAMELDGCTEHFVEAYFLWLNLPDWNVDWEKLGLIVPPPYHDPLQAQSVTAEWLAKEYPNPTSIKFD